MRRSLLALVGLVLLAAAPPASATCASTAAAGATASASRSTAPDGYARDGGRGPRLDPRALLPGHHAVRARGTGRRARAAEPAAAQRVQGAAARAARRAARQACETRTYRFTPGAVGSRRARPTARRSRRSPRPRADRRRSGACSAGRERRRDGPYRGAATALPRRRGVLVVNASRSRTTCAASSRARCPPAGPPRHSRPGRHRALLRADGHRSANAPYDVTPTRARRSTAGWGARSPAASAAVAATRGEIVTYAGHGRRRRTSPPPRAGARRPTRRSGRAAPVPYLRSVDDPYDRLSPYHRWSGDFSDREAARRLADVAPGKLRSLKVVTRTASGRAAAVAVRGRHGTARVRPRRSSRRSACAARGSRSDTERIRTRSERPDRWTDAP